MSTLAAPTPARRAATSPATCVHCSLPIPRGTAGRFCCGGCETAHALIHSCGLEAYYALKDRVDAPLAEVRRGTDRGAYASFDDPAFQRLYCIELPDGTVRIELLLEGLHCAACVWLVERLPRVVSGVIEAKLDVRRASVTVRFDPSETTPSRIGRALASLGYPPHPARHAGAREARRAEDRRMLIRVAVAGACAGNIMLLFFALYAGMFEGIEREHEQMFRWASMLLNTICLAWPGLVFARSALAALRTRTINLDVPIAMGLYLGGAWGIWKTIAGQGDLYFDSISALIFFLLIGRMIQMRQQRLASDALELLLNLGPASARRINQDGTTAEVATESLVPGDVVEIRAGETIPSDGRITRGTTNVDQSMLTGESRPHRMTPGDEVAAGTLNLSSPIHVRVDATGEATRIGKLMRMVEEAGRRRAAIVRLADRLGAWLLWLLLFLAGLTLAIWWPLSPAVAIDRAAALLIATCPCGLGLATPLVMTVAMGQAARRGILVKGGDVFEALSRTGGVMMLDKTGTITRAELAIVRWHGDDSMREAVALLERSSSHPIARALSTALADSSEYPIGCEHIVETPGRGICGVVRVQGEIRRIAAGSERYLAELGATVPHELRRVASCCAERGNSAVLVAVDACCLGVVEVGDPVREDATDSIQRLQRLGWKVRMLSGDRTDVARAVGRRVGLDASEVRGDATPELKLEIVREAAAESVAVMVGDGVNDAAALANATVGIAVRGGAEASLTAADVSLQAEGLEPIVELIEASRRVLRTIHLTIATSLGYNAVAAALAMAGIISPLLAAIIMPASSLTVVAICVRSKPFGGTSRRPVATRDAMREVMQ
ncbi:MAG: heavy metal translocating P-type ATPase [Phycisphaerales bacterium]|nr:heavy metal translocating P-type ATPase [Phycisphaerales bacterium]